MKLANTLNCLDFHTQVAWRSAKMWIYLFLKYITNYNHTVSGFFWLLITPVERNLNVSTMLVSWFIEWRSANPIALTANNGRMAAKGNLEIVGKQTVMVYLTALPAVCTTEVKIKTQIRTRDLPYKKEYCQPLNSKVRFSVNKNTQARRLNKLFMKNWKR
jgi:hypothetical protein